MILRPHHHFHPDLIARAFLLGNQHDPSLLGGCSLQLLLLALLLTASRMLPNLRTIQWLLCSLTRMRAESQIRHC